MIQRGRSLPFFATLLFFIASFAPTPAAAAPPDHWVGTWATSPVALPNTDKKYGAEETTYREIVHVSIGGDTSRVILTNEFGLDPLIVSSASIALRTTGSEIDTTTAHPLTFGGRPFAKAQFARYVLVYCLTWPLSVALTWGQERLGAGFGWEMAHLALDGARVVPASAAVGRQ